MDTQSLQAFLAVADSGSFSRAAEQLHLTQPAVSKRIASLEALTRARLFDRIGRRVSLTEAGRLLLPLLLVGVLCFYLTPRGLLADESTWTAVPARVQVAQDPLLIPKGKGMLFVPAMTLPRDNEPSYQVFQNRRRVASANPGRGVLLEPGAYEVLIGTGAISQMIKKSGVQLTEGNTTLMKPDWAALVIDRTGGSEWRYEWNCWDCTARPPRPIRGTRE